MAVGRSQAMLLVVHQAGCPGARLCTQPSKDIAMIVIERLIAAAAVFVAAHFAMGFINASAGGARGSLLFPFATNAPSRWVFGSLDGMLGLLIPVMIGIAGIAVLTFFLAFLAALGLWVPADLWRPLVLIGVACSVLLLVLHPSVYAALPLLLNAGLAWVAWTSAWTPTPADPRTWRRPMTARRILADRLAILALPLAAIAAAAGLLIPDLYRDTAEGIRQARATDLVTLLVALPALAVGLWRARAGAVGGRLVAMAALGYLAYSYAIYAFAVVIQPLTPVHIAILGLVTWSLVLSVTGLERRRWIAASTFQFPRRTTGGFLIAVAGLFGMLWLSQIVGAITSGQLPAAVSDLGLPTSPVYTLDLAFAVPMITLAGVWLIRRDRRGAVAATAGLAFLSILGLSVLAIFAFEASAGVAVEVPPIAIFGAVTAMAAALLGIGLSGAAVRGRRGTPARWSSGPA